MKMRKLLVMIGFGLACAVPTVASAACVASIRSISVIPNVMYDPFDGVDRSVTFSVVVQNDGAEACSLGLAIASDDPGPRLFKFGGASIEYYVTTGNGSAYVNDIGVPRGVIPLPATLGSSVPVTVRVKVPAGLIAPASTYSDMFRLRLFRNQSSGPPVALDTERTTNGSAVIEARAQVNIAGTGPSSFGTGSVEKLKFGTLESGVVRNANVQVRATAPVSIRIKSENRGALEHEILHSAKVPYTMTLGGDGINLASPVTVFKPAPVSFSGINYPMVLTIGETTGRPAGEYEDTLTITVSPQ